MTWASAMEARGKAVHAESRKLPSWAERFWGIFYSCIQLVCEGVCGRRSPWKSLSMSRVSRCVCSCLRKLRLQIGLFCQCVIDGLEVTFLHHVESLEQRDKKGNTDKEHCLLLHICTILILTQQIPVNVNPQHSSAHQQLLLKRHFIQKHFRTWRLCVFGATAGASDVTESFVSWLCVM